MADKKNRDEPTKIPLPFETAIEGLLAVKPKKVDRRKSKKSTRQDKKKPKK